MKNTKICPKCNQSDIIMVKGSLRAYGAGNNIQVGLSYALVNRYVCCNCGYSEEWVDLKDIPKLKKKFQ